ncbi:MAG: hypothetical protein K6A69_03760 [Lachnospiraceae bacterium]|nr:hypothetical protein [Lachnospiraceae bacterium]
MALIQEINDGKPVNQSTASQKTQNSSSINNKDGGKAKSLVDEDMFLSLLVAEMQYQDPLEPTSNTEYVSELASFTQVSSLQEMNKTVSNLGAQSMVGQYVTVTDDDGNEFSGMVDYTQEKDGELYVCVDDNLYKASSVTNVMNGKYYEANVTASTFKSMMDKQPKVENLRIGDKASLEAAAAVYENMDDYTKQFVSEEDVQKLTSLVGRMNSIINDFLGRFKEGLEKLPSGDNITEENVKDEEFMKLVQDTVSALNSLDSYTRKSVTEDQMKKINDIVNRVNELNESVDKDNSGAVDASEGASETGSGEDQEANTTAG